jgi:hypothetical protein
MACAAKDRVDREQQHDHRVAAERHLHVRVAMLERPSVGTHQPQQVLREYDAGDREGNRREQGDPDRLHRRHRRLVALSFADTARHYRSHRHREAHADRIEQEQHRLGQADRRHRGRTQLADEVNIHDRERRLEHELQHHRHGEQEYCTRQWDLGVVGTGAADRVAQIRPG